MRTLQEKYNAAVKGGFSKAQFVRDASMQLPNLVTQVNSFDDASKILINRGVLAEAKAQEPKYSTAKPEDSIAPDVLDTGIKFELDKKYGTLDVTPEEYGKCREMAIKNLAKDVLYYVKQDSIQLETPGEKMEKAKVMKEEISKEDAWKEFQEKRNVSDKTITAAEEDFNKGWEEGKFRDGNYAANEAIQNIESDEQTKRRIAGLTNQLLQDVDPRDETVKAYAISVKNDLESGDASRMTQYKDILSLDDLKDDMEHYLTHDVDQLEEEDLDPTDKAASAKIGAGGEFTDDDAAAVADKMPKIKKDAEFKLIGEEEPDVEDLYQHDDEYLAQLKQRKALKEMFKKIITKVLND